MIEISPSTFMYIVGIVALIIVSLSALMAFWKKDDSEEPLSLKYILGHPDYNDIVNGGVEIKEGLFIFREWQAGKVLFIIPLKNIRNIRECWKLGLGQAGLMGIGATNGYLYIRFVKDNEEYMAGFSTPSYNPRSTGVVRTKKVLLDVLGPKFKPTPPMQVYRTRPASRKNVITKRFWHYQCPCCKKPIDDNDVILFFGGSLLLIPFFDAWNPENYYGDVLHFHCSKCKTGLVYNWLIPSLRIIAACAIYLIVGAILINKTQGYFGFHDPIVQLYEFGVVIVFLICYMFESGIAKPKVITEQGES